jgi:hypothetical protein
MWMAVAHQTQRMESHYQLSKQNSRNVLICTRFLVGLKPDVVPGVLFVKDNTIVYVCGHNVVICDIKKNTQQYIHGKTLNMMKLFRR